MRGLSVILVVWALGGASGAECIGMSHATLKQSGAINVLEKMGNPTTILQADYKSLPISPSFKRFFTTHQIPDLERLLEKTPKELLKMKGFNERTLKELIDLLEAHELIYLLDRY